MTRDDVVAALRAAGCVFAEDEAELLLATEGDPAELVARRVAGEPLEHLLGWAQFCGLRIAVAAGVFVPRRRTELLARTAVGLVRDGSVVVDLCCGSGAVGAAVAAAVPGVVIHAADVDPRAVACAARNLAPVGGQARVGDLYAALPAELRGRVDVLAVNAPYVPTPALDLMPPEARLHEPRAALDGGSDGLDVQRRVAAGALDWLARGGHLLVETGRPQAGGTSELLRQQGLDVRVVVDDDLGGTVVVGRC